MFFQVCENGKRVKVMMVDLIEKIYSFCGEICAYSAAGWQYTWNFAVDYFTDSGGIYFTIRTRFLPFRLFPDMVRALVEKKRIKQSFIFSGTGQYQRRPGLVWETWSVWLRRFQQVVPGLCSGCG